MDPHNPGRVIGRTEVERREVYMKKLENQLQESHPIIVEMVTYCLHNNPQTRPTAEQLLALLKMKCSSNTARSVPRRGRNLCPTHVS